MRQDFDNYKSYFSKTIRKVSFEMDKVEAGGVSLITCNDPRPVKDSFRDFLCVGSTMNIKDSFKCHERYFQINLPAPPGYHPPMVIPEPVIDPRVMAKLTT